MDQVALRSPVGMMRSCIPNFMLNGSERTHPLPRLFAAIARQQLGGWLVLRGDKGPPIVLGFESGNLRISYAPPPGDALDRLGLAAFRLERYRFELRSDAPATEAHMIAVEGNVSPLSLIEKALAAGTLDNQVQDFIRDLGDRYLRFDTRALPTHLALSRPSREALTQLGSGETAALTLSLGQSRTAFLFSLLGGLKVSAGGAAAVPMPPLLAEKAKLMSQGDTHGLLGVSSEAERSIIEKAYLQLARELHPDKFSGELAAHKDLASKVFSALNQAKVQLIAGSQMSAVKRAQAAAEDAEVAQTIDLAMELQRVEILVRQRQGTEAVERLTPILKEHASNQEARALMVAARLLDAQLPPQTLTDLLRFLVAKEKDSDLALMTLQQKVALEERLGLKDKALSTYKLIAQRDPENIAAKRALHIASRHRGRSEGSLLAKLFRR